jgi:hypothetical protein
MSNQSCPSDSRNCGLHFHDEDPRYLADAIQTHLNDDPEAGPGTTLTGSVTSKDVPKPQNVQSSDDKTDVDFQRIIRNFTPSYVQFVQPDPIDADEYCFFTVGS